ncbi:anti-sigma factor domain-containing protein [Psychrobacillus sp. FSL K6-2836]|uniref:anti-sigma factor domain-containing protein n=1 Tax=Psychrobacillus sp. FSL K6-2836 TaxID=2921548 RepID=UPI0030FB6A1E
MRKYRGIVCEKKAAYSVFLTEDGEFLRGVPLIEDVQIGEEAEFRLIAPSTSSKRVKPIFIAPALVAAVLLIFLVASWFPQTTTAYAYIQVEGDSTIEIGVDEEGKVMSLHSTTGAMKDWKGQSIDSVLAKAVEQVSTEKKELAVTTVYEKEDKPKLKKQIEKAVQEVKKAKSSSDKSSVETKSKKAQPTTKPPGQIKKEEKSSNSNTPATSKEQKNPPKQNTKKTDTNINQEQPTTEAKPTNNSNEKPGQEKKKNEDKSNNKPNNGNKNNGNNNGNGNNNNNNNNDNNNDNNNGNNNGNGNKNNSNN